MAWRRGRVWYWKSFENVQSFVPEEIKCFWMLAREETRPQGHVTPVMIAFQASYYFHPPSAQVQLARQPV